MNPENKHETLERNILRHARKLLQQLHTECGYVSNDSDYERASETFNLLTGLAILGMVDNHGLSEEGAAELQALYVSANDAIAFFTDPPKTPVIQH